jgi:hypothetical protein
MGPTCQCFFPFLLFPKSLPSVRDYACGSSWATARRRTVAKLVGGPTEVEVQVCVEALEPCGRRLAQAARPGPDVTPAYVVTYRGDARCGNDPDPQGGKEGRLGIKNSP